MDIGRDGDRESERSSRLLPTSRWHRVGHASRKSISWIRQKTDGKRLEPRNAKTSQHSVQGMVGAGNTVELDKGIVVWSTTYYKDMRTGREGGEDDKGDQWSPDEPPRAYD
jgi:hypothetical protein